MEEDEDIKIVFTKFQTLVLGLRMLQKFYKIVDHVKKILKSLSRKWRPKIIAIQEAKEISIL